MGTTLSHRLRRCQLPCREHIESQSFNISLYLPLKVKWLRALRADGRVAIYQLRCFCFPLPPHFVRHLPQGAGKTNSFFVKLHQHILGSPLGELSRQRLKGAHVIIHNSPSDSRENFSLQRDISIATHTTPLRHRFAMPPLPQERLEGQQKAMTSN